MNRKQRRIAEAQQKHVPDVQEKFQQAVALHAAGNAAQAKALYETILGRHPDHFGALHLSAVLATQAKQHQTALELIDKAIKVNPDVAEVHSDRGAILREMKQWNEALASCDRAAQLKPGYAEAYSNRGVILQEQGQWEAALASYDKALALKPDHAEAWSNCGVVLKELKQWDMALASFDRAIALKPDYAEAYSNRGNALKEMMKLDAAMAFFDQAIALSPDYADAHLNKSVTLLLSGDFERGWKEFEWRWKTGALTQRHFPQPLWLGKESLAGKTILLHAEQGLGDTIQFCRYAKMITDLGAKVVLVAPKALAGVLATVKGVAELIVNESALVAFDYHCPLLSLPLAFGTTLDTIPAEQKYLTVAADKMDEWKPKLGVKTKPRVGLVWRGSKAHKNDHNRSIALADLMRHLPAGFQYVSLQKEVNAADSQVLHAHPQIFHFGDALEDFSDTAALCELMDVVISVDTSVAHLSAALGRPTWILLPFIPDWRWLLDRQDSPWYLSATLYRQDAGRQWGSVFERVRADLLRLKP